MQWKEEEERMDWIEEQKEGFSNGVLEVMGEETRTEVGRQTERERKGGCFSLIGKERANLGRIFDFFLWIRIKCWLQIYCSILQ